MKNLVLLELGQDAHERAVNQIRMGVVACVSSRLRINGH